MNAPAPLANSADLDRTLELLGRLVAFRSISSESNLDLVDWAKALFEPLGAEFRQTFNEDGRKSNLVISLGPRDRPGVVLSGHVDVVPVEGQSWTTDAFALRVRDRLAFGRGTADMKGFIACCMAQLLKEPADRLRRPVHLALSYDEEVGCLGAPAMVEELREAIPTPVLVVVGEPTMMEIVTSHKAVRVFETSFKGRAAHSSLSHLGASANVHAAEFISYLARTFEDLKATTTAAKGLVPPYTTFNVGILQGGNALNIIPEDARLVWEFRSIPEADGAELASMIHRHLTEEIGPKLSSLFPEAGVSSRELANVPALRPADNRAARELMASLTGLHGDGAVAFGTEAGIFQQAGFPTIVCGPGTIDVAHKPDEHIALDQLVACNEAIDAILSFCRQA